MELKVTFLPEKTEVAALAGLTLLELARRANIGISAQCGGRGTCGKCLVKVSPCSAPNASERKLIPAAKLDEGYRLACQTRIIDQDLTVFVPPESRYFNLKILVSGLTRDFAVRTTIRKYFLKLEPPTIEDQRPDWTRLQQAIATASGLKKSDIEITIHLLRRIPGILRSSGFQATAVMLGDKLISLEPGDTTAVCRGMAFDLGTTTIVGSLIDIAEAREIAVASRTNPQSAFGADVVSRINYATASADGAVELQRLVVRSFNEIITELCQKTGSDCQQIYETMVVGNSAMEHLFLQLPAGSLATSPYVGVYRQSLSVPARKMGLATNEEAVTQVAPLISGFVGGDTVAGILATNLHRESKLRLFIDIGTNGEIVIGNREGLWCAAAAAGPAFEGANIHYGMRAEPGAIDKVRLEEDVRYSTIAEKPARGICGTGLVETVSELLRRGILEDGGRLKSPAALSGLPAAIAGRIRETPEPSFLLDPQSGCALFQKDIRQLQLAKAAIAAGIEILLKKIGLTCGELDEVLLAGAFGSYIDPVAALRLGLLPAVPLEKIRFVGNTALIGSKMMLLSEDMKKEAETIPELCRYVELFHEQEFNDLFVDNLSFPPQDLP